MKIDGVFMFNLERLLEGFVDENQRDKAGETLFRKARDVANQGAEVEGDDQKDEQGGPEADPHTERHKVPVLVSRYRMREYTSAVI